MKINIAQYSSNNGGGKEVFNHFTVNGEEVSESHEMNSGVYDATFTYDPIPGREYGVRKINLARVSDGRVSDGEDKSLPTLVIVRSGKKTWGGRELDGNAICGPNWTIALLSSKTRVWVGRNWNGKNCLLGSWAGNADENPPMFYCQCPPSTKFLRMRFQKNESAWAENVRLNAAIEIFAAAKGIKIDQVVLVDEFPEESMTWMANAGYGMELVGSSHPLPEPGDFQFAGCSIVGGSSLPADLQWIIGREHWCHPVYGWKNKTVLFLKRGALQLMAS